MDIEAARRALRELHTVAMRPSPSGTGARAGSLTERTRNLVGHALRALGDDTPSLYRVYMSVRAEITGDQLADITLKRGIPDAPTAERYVEEFTAARQDSMPKELGKVIYAIGALHNHVPLLIVYMKEVQK